MAETRGRWSFRQRHPVIKDVNEDGYTMVPPILKTVWVGWLMMVMMVLMELMELMVLIEFCLHKNEVKGAGSSITKSRPAFATSGRNAGSRLPKPESTVPS